MRTDYKDFIASTENRHYRQIDNDDGSISLVDETVYTQEGDKVSAGVLNELSQNAIWPLQYAKSGTVHQLTGLTGVSGIVSCVFTATDSFDEGDTVTVDGETYVIQLSNGEAAETNLFVSGVTVSIVVDKGNKKVNFKAGGGLTASKLALANATAGDVRSGKKFYAGDATLKTGTLNPIKYKSGTFTVPATDETTSVSVGFKPTRVFIFVDGSTGDKGVFIYGNTPSVDKSAICEDGGAEYIRRYVNITSNGFSFTKYNAGYLSEGDRAEYWAYS